MYNVNDLKNVFIGRRGEKGARTVQIDVTEMLEGNPSATIKLLMQPAGSIAHEASISVTDGILTWTVGELDTSYAGDHPFEVRAIKSGWILKSRIGYAHVDGSVGDPGETIPGPVEYWADQLEELVEAFPESSTSDDLEYIMGV